MLKQIEHKMLTNRFMKYTIFLLGFSVIIFLVFTLAPFNKLSKPFFLIGSDNSSNYTDCPQNVVSIIIGGRLGNVIWEYLSLISVSKSYKPLKPYIPEEMQTELLKVFEKTGTELFETIPEHCLTDDRAYFVSKDEKEINKKAFKFLIIYLPKYSVRYNDILPYGTEFIRSQLKYHQYLVEYSDNYLKMAKKACKLENKPNVTYIGVHYRGGDYIKFLNIHYKNFSEPPDHRYYQLAMNHFRSLYKHVIFIFITVDKDWLNENLGHLNNTEDTFIKPMVLEDWGVYEDLAILSHCNHSIINYGTYGSYGALYTGGTTIAYDLGLEEDYRGYTIVKGISNLLPNWHLCNNTICNIKN